MEEKEFVNFKGVSKIDQIKNHLENKGYITGLISMQIYKVYRLSSVINRLRKRGMDIKTVMIKADSNHALYAKYFLNE